MKKNRYVVSDIHGCVNTLKSLLKTIAFSKADELYILGDYVDRGPDSKGVIDFIMNLEEAGYQVFSLIGNHEHMLYEEIKNEVWPPGVPETLKSFGVKHNNEIPTKYVNWINNLKYRFEIDHFILVHAGFSFNSKNPFDDKHDSLWVRDWYKKLDKEWLGNRIIIHGHTPIFTQQINQMVKDLDKNQVLNIDNGCVYNEDGLRHLCCFNLDTRAVLFEKNCDKFHREF